jgi:hypothetical protein
MSSPEEYGLDKVQERIQDDLELAAGDALWDKHYGPKEGKRS